MNTEIIEFYKQSLDLQAVDVNTTSPLILAYIGDCIYDLAVREYVVIPYPGALNQVTVKKTTFVCAHAQSEIMGWFIANEVLSEKELSIYKRGRNQKSATHSKNSSIQEYRRATGFEALIGALYLDGQYERAITLIQKGLGHLIELEQTVGSIKNIHQQKLKGKS